MFNPKATYENIVEQAQYALLTILAAFGLVERAYVQSDTARPTNAQPSEAIMRKHNKSSHCGW